MKPRYRGDTEAQQLRDFRRCARVAEHLANIKGTPPRVFEQELTQMARRFGVVLPRWER